MKKLFFLLILIGLLLAGLAWALHPGNEESSEQRFTLVPITHGPLAETVSATGVLQPQEVIPVGTELSGTVVEIAADFNKTVSEGDLLFRLDDRLPRQKLRQAQVAIAVARAEVERARTMQEAAFRTFDRLRNLPENVSLRKDLDAAEAHWRAMEAGVAVAEARAREAEEGQALAELAVRLTEIRVPVLTSRSSGLGEGAERERPPLIPSLKISQGDSRGPGEHGLLAARGPTTSGKRKFIVLERRVDLNQQIGPPLAAQAFVLAGDLGLMQVAARVAEGDISRVQREQSVSFTVASYGEDVRFTGRVTDLRLTPISDHGAIFYKILIEAANTLDENTGEWQLRPGMTTSVDVLVRKQEAVWRVPLAALNLVVPEADQTDAARAKLAQWRSREDRQQWQPVWTLDNRGQPWPLLVQVANARGPAIRDDESCEVLAWDPELQPAPDRGRLETFPRLIVNILPPRPGLFNLPRIKI